MNVAYLLAIVTAVVTAVSAVTAVPTAPISWRANVPNASWGTPEIYNEYLIVAGDFYACGASGSSAENQAQDFVYVFNRFTGNVVWSAAFDTCGVFVSAGEGLVYVAAYYPIGSVRAYDIETGNKYWEYTAPSSYFRADLGTPQLGKPTYYAGRLYITWYTTPMFVLDSQTGVFLGVTDFTVGSRIYVSSMLKAAYFITIGEGAAPMYAATAVTLTQGVPTLLWSKNISTQFTSMTADNYVVSVLTSNNNVNVLKGYDQRTGLNTFTNVYTTVTSNTNFDYNCLIGGTFATFQNVSASTQFLRIDPMGKQQWVTSFPTTDNNLILVASDKIIVGVGQQTNMMFAIDAVAGHRLWTRPTNGASYGTAAEGYYYYPEYAAIVALNTRV